MADRVGCSCDGLEVNSNVREDVGGRAAPWRYRLKVAWRVIVSLNYGFLLVIAVLIYSLVSSGDRELTPGYLQAKLERGMSFEECRKSLGMCTEVEPVVDGRVGGPDNLFRNLTFNAVYIDLLFEGGNLTDVEIRRRTGWKVDTTLLTLKERAVDGEAAR